MSKTFEDNFTELQTDMIAICLENVEDRAEKIYIYCSCEEGEMTGGYFYKINEKLVQRHKLNDAIKDGEKPYDISPERQDQVLDIIIEDIEKIQELCKSSNRQMPTEIKIIYDVQKNSVNADYKYDNVYSQSDTMTPVDVEDAWFEEIASEK